MPRCNSCDARIVWARTEAKEGKPARSMPLDADDDGTPAVPGNGNLVQIGTEPSGAPVVRYVPKGKGLFVSHFATCPNGPSHRKAKR